LTESEINFQFFLKNDSLLNSISNHEELQHLIRFSQGYYTVEKWNDTLVFNDLRFGQMAGWYNPKEKFVFHFFLQLRVYHGFCATAQRLDENKYTRQTLAFLVAVYCRFTAL